MMGGFCRWIERGRVREDNLHCVFPCFVEEEERERKRKGEREKEKLKPKFNVFKFDLIMYLLFYLIEFVFCFILIT